MTARSSAPSLDLFDQHVGAETFHADLDKRVCPGKPPKGMWQQPVGIVVRRAEAHRARHLRPAKGLHGLVVETDQTPRVVEQMFAIAGQPALAAVAHEEGFLHRVLQTLHLHADRGLGLVNIFRSAGETSRFNNCDECAQQIEVERPGH